MSKVSEIRWLCLPLMAALVAPTAEAQLFERALKSIQRGAERAVEREAERRADRAVTEAIECAVGDTACEEERARQQQNQSTPTGNNATGQSPSSTSSQGSGQGAANTLAKPGSGAWANYDFVPGDKVLFVEDFLNDRVGNFPRRLRFIEGNTEIVQLDGARALRVNSIAKFDVQLSAPLPERFTIEMDIYLSDFVNNFEVYPVDRAGKRIGEQFIRVDSYGGVGVDTFGDITRGGGMDIKSLQPNVRVINDAFTPVRVSVDGGYIKVYVNEIRVANLPQGNLGRSEFLRFDFSDVRSQPVYLRRIHVAETDRSLYDRLSADGRVATQGIYFDPNKSELRPESTPTLLEIADVLRRDTNMQLLIEGHTDNTGDAESNRFLSERRAQAVFDYLVTREQIPAQRLQFSGLGDTKPIAENTTVEGRQQNRRVELAVLR